MPVTERVIDISGAAASLSVSRGQLAIKTDSGKTTVPLVDIAALVVSHPSVTYSQAVLSGIAREGGTFIACDEKHMPLAMLLPLVGHYVQAERMAMQATISVPLKKQLWKQLVQRKIKAQGAVLQEFRGEDHGFGLMAGKVRSGDPDNMEAQAARRYWTALFGKEFRRRREAPDQNRLLNYGYAVLRGLVARAVCASGLHPSMGLHHHNRYDSFCLADDLMEPFRPLVDMTVAGIVQEHSTDVALDPEFKRLIIRNIVDRRFRLGQESRSLFTVLSVLSNSLYEVMAGKRKRLAWPEE